MSPGGPDAAQAVPPRPTRSADGAAIGKRLRERDLGAAPAALNLLESQTEAARAQAAALAHEVSPQALGHEPTGHIVGLTGPPGAGKSTLLAALVRRFATDSSVAVLAVDPSSRRSGGALLGDRLRIELDAPDERVFIRSTAARERHGGLAAATRAAAEALSAAFDVVVIETVGVGQAETEIEDVADTVIVAVQPGAGDVLQFLKAGIMEIPDVLVVTKRDLGELAQRTARELQTAVRSLGAASRDGTPAILTTSSVPPLAGIDELVELLARRQRELAADGQRRLKSRRLQARRAGALTELAIEHGQHALRALGGKRSAERLLAEQDPALSARELAEILAARACRARDVSSG